MLQETFEILAQVVLTEVEVSSEVVEQGHWTDSKEHVLHGDSWVAVHEPAQTVALEQRVVVRDQVFDTSLRLFVSHVGSEFLRDDAIQPIQTDGSFGLFAAFVRRSADELVR